MKNNGLTMVKVEGELFVSKSDYDKLAASFSTLMEQLAITNEAVSRETKLANKYRDKCDKLVAQIAELKGDAVPMFEVEMSCGHWLNMGPIAGADLSALPDGINKLFTHDQPVQMVRAEHAE
jgi:hypothetical protein